MLDLIQARLVTAYYGLKERAEGQALVEYALILALVSIVAIALLAGIGGAVKDKLTGVKASL